MPLFARAMGSPDPYGQQLNGMGGGIPALSKICVVSPSTRPDADVIFEFVQLVVDDGSLDLASNCGNMTGAIGPFSLDQGLYTPTAAQLKADPEHATVRIFNTNTQKIINSTFSIAGQPPRFKTKGDFEMKGIPGTGSRITLSFLSPGGTQIGTVFPSGRGKTTTLETKDKQGRKVRASLMDIANPGVFVNGSELGIPANVKPAELDAQSDMMALLEKLRQEGAEKMGLDPKVASVPKIVILFPPSPDKVAAGVNIRCIAISMGKAHKGIPLTLALNLGAACQMEGTIAYDLVKEMKSGGDVTIQHPGGTIDVGAVLMKEDVQSASLYSTARLLMQGEVNVE